jgi:aldose 1-epimerase
LVWGEVDGQPVHLWTLRNDGGLCAKVTNYGCIVTEMHIPDRAGGSRDVALGFDDLDGYLSDHPYFGAVIGRVANRTSGAQFELDGVTHKLSANTGDHHIHGGFKGFDKQVWTAVDVTGDTLSLRYVSPDGEEGYPGALAARVTYTLTPEDELRMDYFAKAESPTVVNLTHHGYWNLGGHDAGPVLGHELQISATNYTAADEDHTSTGEVLPVEGTAFDFTAPKSIGTDIGRIEFAGDADPLGFDLNFVLDRPGGGLQTAARARDPHSGCTMEIATTKPGLVLYTGNYLDGTCIGKGGVPYVKQAAFCLEAQHFPDAVNRGGSSGWPSAVLRPGETYRHTDLMRFSVTP